MKDNKSYDDTIIRLKQELRIAYYGADETKKAEIKSLKEQLATLKKEFEEYVKVEQTSRSLLESEYKNKIENLKIKYQNEFESITDLACQACPSKEEALQVALEAIKVRDERLKKIRQNAANALVTADFQDFLIDRINMKDESKSQAIQEISKNSENVSSETDKN